MSCMFWDGVGECKQCALSGCCPDKRPKSPYKCPMHNFWMRKGQCEMCLLERDKQRKEYERTGGSNKPPVVIKKI